MYDMAKEEAEFIMIYLLNLEFGLSIKERHTYNYRDHIKEAHKAFIKQKLEAG